MTRFVPPNVSRPPFKLGDVSRLAARALEKTGGCKFAAGYVPTPQHCGCLLCQRPAKTSKYRAVKTVVDGIEFASKAEARRYGELKLLEKGGYIRRLELQPVYRIEINGKRVCKVILDFRYWEGQERVVEDVKGRDNALSRLKRKLIEAAYPGTKIRLVA